MLEAVYWKVSGFKILNRPVQRQVSGQHKSINNKASEYAGTNPGNNTAGYEQPQMTV